MIPTFSVIKNTAVNIYFSELNYDYSVLKTMEGNIPLKEIVSLYGLPSARRCVSRMIQSQANLSWSPSRTHSLNLLFIWLASLPDRYSPNGDPQNPTLNEQAASNPSRERAPFSNGRASLEVLH